MFIFDRIKSYIKSAKEDQNKRWKKLVFAAPFWIIFVSLVLIAVFCIRGYFLCKACNDQYASQYWINGDEDKLFGQVSVYAQGMRTQGPESPLLNLGRDYSLSVADISAMRFSLQGVVDSFAKGKVTGLDRDGSPRGWEDCYSTFLNGTVGIYDEEGTSLSATTDAEVVAVSGNFSAFHPMEYLSGGFLPEKPIDKKQIVINDVLAWKLFRSYDVLGRQLELFGEKFTVIGVVRVPDNKINSKAKADIPRVFIYFIELDELDRSNYFNSDSYSIYLEYTDSKLAVNCYEVLLPESLAGVATSDVLSALPVYNANDPQFLVVRNSGRFSPYEIYDYMIPLGENTRKNAIFNFPYWEKAAVITTETVFVDGCFVLAGIVLLIIGIIMMSLKRNKNKNESQTIEAETDKS